MNLTQLDLSVALKPGISDSSKHSFYSYSVWLFMGPSPSFNRHTNFAL